MTRQKLPVLILPVLRLMSIKLILNENIDTNTEDIDNNDLVGTSNPLGQSVPLQCGLVLPRHTHSGTVNPRGQFITS